jgi:virulence factor Mce-like protein
MRRRGAPPPIKRLIGIALIAGSALVAIGSFLPITFPWNRSMHLTVQAPDFGIMNSDAGVELSGLRVGSVQNVEYKQRMALLHLAISPTYFSKIHADATATIQPHGLLGPKYVSLAPGRKGRMKDGGLIPQSRTTVTTDFDQVINSLQPDVRQNLKVIFVELGTASDGRGQDLHDAITLLHQSMGDLRTTTTVLKNREPETTDFIVSSEEFNRDVQNAPIDQNIKDTNQVLVALVQVEDSIGGTIDHTSSVLQQVTIATDGNSENLAYVLANAPGTVQRLDKYLDTANQIVLGVRPHIPNLMTAVVEGGVGPRSVTGGKDANGHYVRVLALSGACTGAPDPTGTCSSPVTPGAHSPAPAPSNSGGTGSSSELSDAAFAELLLGG